MITGPPLDGVGGVGLHVCRAVEVILMGHVTPLKVLGMNVDLHSLGTPADLLCGHHAATDDVIWTCLRRTGRRQGSRRQLHRDGLARQGPRTFRAKAIYVTYVHMRVGPP